MTHTPGPWQHYPTGYIAGKNFTIAKMAEVPGQQFATNEYLANAHLIAAAPELLQIARDYVLLCELHDTEGAVLDAARAAIAKATGAKP